ncbi:MAG: dienelactone hydrolase family protein [Beijerinckiaceae bacterium]|nr:dienelactone hydrolase family protein [Beijerinckiaceae bacterium]
MQTQELVRAKDLDPALFDLYDQYCHGMIDRRQFMSSVSKYAVAGMSAAALVEMLLPNYALAQQVSPNDPRIKVETITFDSPKGNGPTKGLLAKPATGGKRGAVVVVHENRGLNPYIADVARRLAVAGFTALAPDGLTSLGGYPGDDDKGREMQAKLDSNKLLMDFIAAYDRLKTDPDYNGKIGVVGFCFGGSVANSMAVLLPDLAASVPYYGAAPKAEDVPKIKAPLLVHHGELDKRLVEAWPAYEAALKANGKTYEGYIYPQANHGFHNDTTPRYDKAQAELSWDRTIAFFKKHLG